MQGSSDLDPLGNPYGFTQTPLNRHTPSHPVLVTTQMSRVRSVDQLILMSDGRYLSSETSSMTLRLVSYNADAQALAYIQVPFQWQAAGVIVGGPPLILALPVLAYASSRYAFGQLHTSAVLCKPAENLLRRTVDASSKPVVKAELHPRHSIFVSQCFSLLVGRVMQWPAALVLTSQLRFCGLLCLLTLQSRLTIG